MKTLTKYDVLDFLNTAQMDIDKAIQQIRQNAFFEKTSERKIRLIISELRKEGLISNLALTSKATNTLAFILWSKKDGIDYNIPLKKRNKEMFQKVFESGEIDLIAKSMFSKPTTLKIAKELEAINFIKTIKRKPIITKADFTDRTIFFANVFGYNFGALEKSIRLVRIEKDSPKLKDHLIKLHIYSTTVTEGNTATEKDVERVLDNLDSRLSPKEVIEIVNAKKAVDELYKIYKTEELSVALIKRLHKILMTNLLENPGEFSYTRKRIIGSPVKLPDSRIEIDTELEAMLNFYNNYKDKIDPMILSAIVHFLLVSIHPFIDGNGRVARLIHSFILMKAGLPIFAFDPNYRNKYFDLLDKGRTESIEDFVQFCIDKHKELIDKLYF